MRFYVGITDSKWHEFMSTKFWTGTANFWMPGGTPFKLLNRGQYFFFKLRSPNDYIVGGGTFDRFERMTIGEAWRRFGEGNGFNTEEQFSNEPA